MSNLQPASVVGHIEQLLAERQRHADALSRIDETLFGVYTALEAVSLNGHAAREAEPEVLVPTKKRRGRPPGVRKASTAPIAPKKGRRTRGSYAVTGDDLILGFIRQRRSPTTKEVKAFWASEGRKGTADNVLSKLFKEGRVRRTPLGNGIKGSRYSLTPF